MNLEHVLTVVLGTSLEWQFVRLFVYISLGGVLWRLRPVPRAQRPINSLGRRTHRRPPHYGAWAAATLALLGLVAGGTYGWRSVHQQQQQHKVTAATLRGPVNISGRPYVGVFEPGEQGSYSVVDAFGAQTGQQPQILLYYSAWNQPFDIRFARIVQAAHAIPFVQLLPRGVSMASIADGGSDAFLRSYAAAAHRFGSQVIIGFAPEMNGNWYGWGARHTDSTVYVAAWQHIVRTFRAAGATNVTWLWTVNSENVARSTLKQWWPGDKYVTWVGIDGYYYLSTDSFESVFGTTISDIRAFTNRPVLISETAVGPNAERAAQIDGMFRGIKKAHLVGIVWFDQAQNAGVYHQNWRLEGDAAALAAFRKGAQFIKQPAPG